MLLMLLLLLMWCVGPFGWLRRNGAASTEKAGDEGVIANSALPRFECECFVAAAEAPCPCPCSCTRVMSVVRSTQKVDTRGDRSVSLPLHASTISVRSWPTQKATRWGQWPVENSCAAQHALQTVRRAELDEVIDMIEKQSCAGRQVAGQLPRFL